MVPCLDLGSVKPIGTRSSFFTLSTQPTYNQVPPAESSEHDVRTTVFNFDQFKIKKFSHRNITILEASGTFNSLLGRELERQAAQVRNNLGLDLAGISGLQPTILATLKNIHRRHTSRSKVFLLCNPPEKLLDLLKLNDMVGQFQIASGIANPGIAVSSPLFSDLESKVASGQPVKRHVAETPGIVQKKIAYFNQTLKRTEKLEKGLDSASRCIRKILPTHVPEVEEYEFAFTYVPSDKVGGDFFDFIPLEGSLLGVLIGDVSGHGLDSAIIMGMAKKVIRLRAKDFPNHSTTEILCRVNADLFEDLGRRSFITVLYAVIDLDSGEVRFARAGHEPPLHFKLGAGGSTAFHHSAGIAIGIDPGARFNEIIQEHSIALAPGEGLILYTDGIVECWNLRKDLFSRKRLAYAIEHLQDTRTAEGVIQTINTAVEQFSQGTPQEDDMTAIAILRI